MDSSSLTLLPPELRDLIYVFTFQSAYAITLNWKTTHIQHPLTRTCRSLRAETLALYYSLTRFNAHLDDGPAAPLGNWMQAIGPEQCLQLREVNIWDLRMLKGSLHGVESTNRMLESGSTIESDAADDSNQDQRPRQHQPYILKPIGRDIFRGSWYLRDLLLALQKINLQLWRFCEVQEDGQLKQTSQFAIQSAGKGGDVDECGLAGQFGLDERERRSIAKQLCEGKRKVMIVEANQALVLFFDETRRLVEMHRKQRLLREADLYNRGETGG